MSLFSRLLGRLEKKESAAGPVIAFMLSGKQIPTPRDYERLSHEGYRKNSVVFRCVNLISECAAAVPWQLFRGQGEDKELIEEHPILTLLSAPNPMSGGMDFFKRVYSFRLLSGNSYLEYVEAGGVPMELWTHRPEFMRVVAGDGGMPEAYTFATRGRTQRWDVDKITGRTQLLHSKSFHPLDDWYGMSPLEAAAFEIDQHNAAGAWNYSLLKNQARPSGALVYSPTRDSSPDTMSDEQYLRAKEQIDELYSGAGSEELGRPMLFEGSLKWEELSISPKDMDWLQGRDMSARDIAMAYDVPPQLVGISGSQTFANFEQARLSLYEDAVMPLLDGYTDDLNRWLVPIFDENLHLEFDQDAIPALAVRRREKWAMVQSSTILTINEKRQELGFDRIENPLADEVFVEASKLPLGADVDVDDDEAEATRQLVLPPRDPEEARRQFLLAYGNGRDMSDGITSETGEPDSEAA